MHDAGAATFAQDENTCVVYCMPREAVAAGGVNEGLPLKELAEALIRAAERAGKAARL